VRLKKVDKTETHAMRLYIKRSGISIPPLYPPVNVGVASFPQFTGG